MQAGLEAQNITRMAMPPQMPTRAMRAPVNRSEVGVWLNTPPAKSLKNEDIGLLKMATMAPQMPTARNRSAGPNSLTGDLSGWA